MNNKKRNKTHLTALVLCLFFHTSATFAYGSVNAWSTIVNNFNSEEWRDWWSYHDWVVYLGAGYDEENPCYKQSDCYIVYGEQFDSSGFSVYTRIPKLATNYKYLRDVLDDSARYSLNGKHYNPISHTFPVNYPCINIGYQIGYTTPISNYGGGECQGETPLPPPPSCSIKPASVIELQHPTLSAEELAGNTKGAIASVSCTKSASVKLTINGLNTNSQLQLANNGELYTTLKINDALAVSGVTLRNVGPGGSQFNVSSTLGVKGMVQGGQYSASAILILTIL